MRNLQTRIGRQPHDGKIYTVLSRGSIASMRIDLDEIPDLCDRLIDIYEQENK